MRRLGVTVIAFALIVSMGMQPANSQNPSDCAMPSNVIDQGSQWVLCTVEQTVLLAESNIAGAFTVSATDSLDPTLEEQLQAPLNLASEGGVPAPKYLGNNTCRYYGTSSAVGNSDGNGTYGVDDRLGVYTRSESYTSGVPFPGTDSDYAQAEGGVALSVGKGWPQPSSLHVTMPWHSYGKLDVDSGFNPLGGHGSATASYWLDAKLIRGSESSNDLATSRVATDSLPTNFGPRQEYPNRVGTVGLNLSSLQSGQQIRGLLRARSSTQATSTYLAEGFAVSDFFGYGHSWADYQDWHFTLPSGWRITKCA